MKKAKLIRITTVPESLHILLKGQLGFINNFFNVIAISSESKLLDDVSKRERVKTLAINMTRQITPLKDLISLYKLYNVFKEEKPFIVHTHTPKAGLLGMLAAYFAKVPNRLHTIAGLPVVEATGLKRKILLLVEKVTYSCATKVYPNSLGLKNIVLENKLTPASKLRIIGNGSSNGIDTNYFNPLLVNEQELINLREELKIKKDDFVYIFVGRIVSDKGINELVEAFVKISKSNNNVKLLLVGHFESKLDPLNAATLKEINRNNQIIPVGFQADVRPYFKLSNCLVFPSYREGFPNVVMQSGSMGLPAIVSDINGCNEIITNNENGIIVPKKNIGSLLKAMCLINSDKKLYNSLKLNSRNKIVNNYSQEIFWKELLNTYHKL